MGTPSRDPRQTEAGGYPGTPYLQLPCRAVSWDGALDRGVSLQGEGVRTELNCRTRRTAWCVCVWGRGRGRTRKGQK